MNINDVIKLIDAGYSKAEIDALASRELSSAASKVPAAASPAAVPAASPAAVPAAWPAAVPAASPAAVPAEAPEQDLSKLISEAIAKELKAFGEQMKMPAMPSIGDIQPKGIEDVIRNFFKED